MHIIGGKHKKRRLLTPSTEETRPTAGRLRECVFNICQGDILDAYFLDLFAGTGAMGLEALSRGALLATFVENQRTALQCLKRNIATLQEEAHTRIWGGDALKALEALHREGAWFHIIYADPPYHLGWGAKILAFIDAHPQLLHPMGILFIEDTQESLPPLQHLELEKSRTAGRATLCQFRIRTQPEPSAFCDFALKF